MPTPSTELGLAPQIWDQQDRVAKSSATSSSLAADAGRARAAPKEPQPMQTRSGETGSAAEDQNQRFRVSTGFGL